MGYVNELLARLTGNPVNDHTQTNHTLDSSPETFPLDRTFYADFTHENVILAVLSAMGFFKQHHKLDPSSPNSHRTWVASHMVPFSARMVVEKLECAPSPKMPVPVPKGTFVRVFLNDKILPMEICDEVPGSGLCSLQSFVKSQSYARHDGKGDFEKCYE